MLKPLIALACLGSSLPVFSASSLTRASDDFSRVAVQVNPSVVNISSSQIVRSRNPQSLNDLFDENFMAQGREYRRQSLGSGFVLSADGKILTNAHVVADADEISVRLDNGDVYAARVLGSDDGVDLAVLKIEPKLKLTPARLGDSNKVKVGDWAIAIGNPFGLDHSLTVGVISAKERTNVFSEDGKARYQNFLQTDASINHGNSGGPLCNIKGEVIGVNTAILSPGNENVGISFAIPINMVKRAVPDLVKSGRVITPKLGFYTQDIDAAMAKVLDLGTAQGVLVRDVAADGAADKAGLKRGDVILFVNGKSAASQAELKTRLYEAKPGESLLLTVLREGKPMGLHLEPIQPQASAAWHGIQVQEAQGEGLQVVKVLKDSSAEQIGLMPGDILLEVNQKRLINMDGWKKMSKQVPEEADAILQIMRGRGTAYVLLPGKK